MKVDQQILAILSKDLQRSDLQMDSPLEMSSIQILRALAQLERTFGIEIEDENIFRGLFRSARSLSDYVQTQLEETF